MLTSAPPRTMIATPSRISSPPRVTMNDGILSRATSDPWMAPTAEQASNAAMIAAHHGQFRAARLHKLGDHDAAKRHDQADGEVDLPEEQGEDLSHRQHHVHGALLEEVDQVQRRQELRVRDLEADGDHHDGQDHRQDTAVATADPEPPGPEVLAQRLGEELGRDVGRGGLRGGGEVGHHPGVGRLARGLSRVRGHGEVRHGSRSRSRAVTARQPALRRGARRPARCIPAAWPTYPG